jgi:hypothetical protein
MYMNRYGYLGQSVRNEDKKNTADSTVPPVEDADPRVAAMRRRLHKLDKNAKAPGGIGYVREQ